MSLAQRINDFYNYIGHPTDPAKIAGIAEKYRSDENALWSQLAVKYNLPSIPPQFCLPDKAVPTPQNSTKTSVVSSPGSYHDRLVRFYQVYDPKRISVADKLLERFQGHEEDLFRSLRVKYGPEPKDDDLVIREKLISLYEFYDKSKLENIDEILEKYKGRYGELLSFLKKKYGAVPTNDENNNNKDPASPHHESVDDTKQLEQRGLAKHGSTHQMFRPIVPVNHELREKLFRIYFFYEPSKLENLDFIENLLLKYRGRESNLFAQLEVKYGPAPPPLPTTNHKENLIKYYTFYGMHEKIPMVDALLQKYQGIEDEMWFLLASKYGFPPSGDASTPTKKRALRERLFNYYRKYDPSRASMQFIDEVILRYGEDQNKLWQTLYQKYGPE